MHLTRLSAQQRTPTLLTCLICVYDSFMKGGSDGGDDDGAHGGDGAHVSVRERPELYMTAEGGKKVPYLPPVWV